MDQFLDSLLALDRELFAKINLDWTNGFFDWFFPAITDLHKSPWFLIAVLVLLGWWIWAKRRMGLRWILVLTLAVGCSDLFAYRVVKSIIDRPRPEMTLTNVQLRTHSHTGSSFPSNHASNMFAAATVLSEAFPLGTPLFYFIAALVAYSRVYVGVHYPLDVLCGAIFGMAVATICLVALRRFLRSA